MLDRSSMSIDAAAPRHADVPAWAGLAMAAGGALHVSLWPVFTSLHGPTSFNEDGQLLGGDALLWGALMEGPSGLLIAAGLAASWPLLVVQGGRAARGGFWMAMVALVVSSAATLALRGPVAPVLAGLLGAGLLLMAYGDRRAATVAPLQRLVLAGLGATQLFAFVWTLVVRPDLLDRIDGYRIYGLVANVLFGVGWIVLGLGVAAGTRARARSGLMAARVRRPSSSER
jgi:hypothetical protein